jgi:hypothetical protein
MFLKNTVVGVVVSVYGTLTNKSSAGTGSNPTKGIQSSIYCCREILSNIECSISVYRIREDFLRKILWDPYNSHWCLTGCSSFFLNKKQQQNVRPSVSYFRRKRKILQRRPQKSFLTLCVNVCTWPLGIKISWKQKTEMIIFEQQGIQKSESYC